MSDEKFWTKEAVYDVQISPLMAQIIEICKEHQIPLVATFQYGNDEEHGPMFVTTSLPFEGVACEKIRRLSHAVQPERAVCLAETIVTQPDGSKHITIKRVS